jgi:hypothetical protein
MGETDVRELRHHAVRRALLDLMRFQRERGEDVGRL